MLEASADVYGLSSVEPLIEQHLIRRALDPHEVAAMVAWLCSRSSSGVTGAIVAVDAGATSR
jgi:enoyl-[acyl-carrier-protein] reductase (NADH)